MSDPALFTDRQLRASAWFRTIRDRICAELSAIDGEAFAIKPWTRGDESANHTPSAPQNPHLNGGGEMALLRDGAVFEKAGVNISEVYGTFSDTFGKEIPGAAESNGAFWAAGVSLVIHPRSPHVPAVHMNTRMICTSKIWFGGGADLTPIYMDAHAQDGADFHAAFKSCCARHPESADYERFKQWCDDYFFLPHRNEPRGLGGIFYDYLEHDWEKDFAFTRAVGETFANIYPEIVRRHKDKPWTEQERAYQLQRRGRYVEFNLLHDRGTKFGLMTGGNTEAILMSMPPLASW